MLEAEQDEKWAESTGLQPFVEELAPEPTFWWAWQNYKPTLLKLAQTLEKEARKPRALEIGGGRDPTFTADEGAAHFARYTVNDIAQSELDRAPAYVEKRCFDIAGHTLPETGSYDLIFSKMVFEHIPDAAQAYRNTCALLAPGGVALHFFPTLFSPPFILNKLLPERLSGPLLKFFFPFRNAGEYPKFPADYDWCYGTESNRARIQAMGFTEAAVLPFYGHGYFEIVPCLKQLDAALSRLAQRRDWRRLSSYAYMMVRK